MNANEMEVVFPGGKKVDVLFDGYRVETDQQGDDGSPGAAPEPLDLLFASMASCVGVTVNAFFRARNIDMAGIRLVLRRKPDPERKMCTEVEFDLTLPDAFPEKYRNAVVRAMNLCSVKKQLLHPPRFLMRASRHGMGETASAG